MSARGIEPVSTRIRSSAVTRLLALGLALGAATMSPAAASQAVSLARAYELALANAPKLRVAEHRVDAREGAVARAKGQRLPTLSLNASQARSQFDAADTGINPDTLERRLVTTEIQETQSTVGLTLSQPLYDRGISQGIDRAESQRATAERQLKASRQTLAIDVARAYVEVLRQRAAARLGRAERRAFELEVERIKGRLERGLGDQLELLEAQGRLDDARARIAKAENNLQVARLELERLIGQSVSHMRAAQPKAMFGAQPPGKDQLNEWQHLAVRSNPNVLVEQQRLETRREAVDESRAGHFPRLSLQLSAQDTDRTDQVTSGQSARAMLQLEMPLYSGGRVSAGVDEAVAEAEQQRAQLDEARRQAVLEVRRAANELRSAIKRLQVLEGSLRTATTAVEQARQGLESGLRNRVDLLDARARAFEVRRDLADAAYNRIAALVRVHGLTGGIDRERLQTLDDRFLSRTIAVDRIGNRSDEP